MHTVKIKLLKFHELDDDARMTAIDNYREENARIESDSWSSDVRASQNAFLALFDSNSSNFSVPPDSEDLNGVRLATYILNNYGDHLLHPKLYYKGAITGHTRFYKSKIQTTKDAVLTGVICDDYFTQGIWGFIKNPDGQDFSTLLENCVISAWEKYNDDIDEAYNNDDRVAEQLEAQDFDFMENGEIFDLSLEDAA